jgi:DNA-binding transcriptional regulator YiaG
MLQKVTMTGDELKQIRASLGMTQEVFADLVRVTRVTVARWEAGLANIPPFVEWALNLLQENHRLKRKLKQKGAKKPYGRVQKKR